MTDASKRKLAIVAETVPGTTPATPAWMAVGHSTANLKPAIQRIESRLIRPTRDVLDSIDVSRSAGGTIDAELQHAISTQGLWRLWLSALQSDADSAQDEETGVNLDTGNTLLKAGIGTGVEVGDIVRIRDGATNALISYNRVSVVSAPALTVEGPALALNANVKVMRGRRIKNGITSYPSSIEISEDTDGNGVYDKFEYLTNMNVDTARLRVADGEVTALTFGFVGANSDGGTSTRFAGSTDVEAPSTEVMNSKGHVKAIRVAAADFTAKSLEFNIANGMAPRTVIGQLPAISIRSGTFRATGSLTAYFATFTEYSKAVAGTASSVMVAWEDSAGNGFAVALPRIKYTDQERPSTGQDTDIFVNLQFATLNAGGDDDASMRIYSFIN